MHPKMAAAAKPPSWHGLGRSVVPVGRKWVCLDPPESDSVLNQTREILKMQTNCMITITHLFMTPHTQLRTQVVTILETIITPQYLSRLNL